MEKFNKLSRAEMKNVKGGHLTPTCSAKPCFAPGGAGTCGQGTLTLTTCPCIVNGRWDGITVCTTG